VNAFAMGGSVSDLPWVHKGSVFGHLPRIPLLGTSVNNPSGDTLRFFKCQHLSDRKYLIENDKIVAQTIHYTVEQKK
jgi:hypothetical protein